MTIQQIRKSVLVGVGIAVFAPPDSTGDRSQFRPDGHGRSRAHPPRTKTARPFRIEDLVRTRRCPGAERRDTGHLLGCRACLVEVRLAAAWRKIPRPVEPEAPEPVSESFLARVSTTVSQDRVRRRQRRRTLLSAAAALLFFFLAGAGHESRAGDAVCVEESCARLLAPSALEGLPPD